MANVPLTFPYWSENLFRPKRYKIAHGGRGSGKSFTFTDALIVRALTERVRVLCAREFQNSISDSVHRLLNKRIEDLGLSAYFTIQRDTITSSNGSEFTFKGLRHNSESIRSTAGINICWIEEAQTISQESLDILIPTIREPDSEIWMTMNPRLESDPVYRLFIAKEHPDAYLFKVNYTENIHFPAVLEAERRLMLERDPALYRHVWEGECLTHTDAQIFKDKWEVREFTPDNWNLPFYGMDFGFSQDPTACVKVWVHDDTLYIEKEAVKVGLELDDTADYIKSFMPEIENGIIRADCARPESISYLKRHGLPRIQAVKKWGGSVEDGITHIRSYKSIVVHPRCKETINEMMLYSYKVDQRTGDITTAIIDKYNHCIAEGVLVACESGNKPIEDVTINDKVFTRQGFKNVLFAGVTDKNRKVLKIETTGGILYCTPDHLVYTVKKGFVKADALRYNDDIIIVEDEKCKAEKNVFIKEKLITDTLALKEEQIDYILKKLQSIYTGKFGLTILEIFLKAFIYITKMAILQIITLKTLNAYLQKSIVTNTHTQKNHTKNKKCILKKYALSQKRGTLAKKVLKSIEKLGRCLINHLFLLTKNALTAKNYLKPKKWDTQTCFVQTNVNQHIEELVELITLKKNAPIVKSHLKPTNIAKLNHVQGHVLCISDGGVSPNVYDLTVEDCHEFFANGVLVHNCIDSLRYSLTPLMKRKYTFVDAFSKTV